MTKKAFKKEVIRDLEYQVNRKGRNWTSEAWYMSDELYPLNPSMKRKGIEELIRAGFISRVSSLDVHPMADGDFPVLELAI